LLNNGLYNVHFKFELSTKLSKKIFVLDVQEGEIAPNVEQEIRFTFMHTSD